MSETGSDPVVTVWCDDASHPARRARVFIGEFSRPNVMWQPTKGRRHSGLKWWFNDDGTVHKEPGAGYFALTRVDMTCRYCKRRPLTLRLGKLDAALTLVADAGRDEVTLSELLSILDNSRK